MSIGNIWQPCLYIYISIQKKKMLFCSTWPLNVVKHIQVPSNSFNFPGAFRMFATSRSSAASRNRSKCRSHHPLHREASTGHGMFHGMSFQLWVVLMLENPDPSYRRVARCFVSLFPSFSDVSAVSKRSLFRLIRLGLPDVTKASFDSITIGHLFRAKSCNQHSSNSPSHFMPSTLGIYHFKSA